MSSCCSSVLDSQFDTRNADADAARYRRDGAPKETRLLLAALREAGVTDQSVLDIGGGIGAVQLDLLEAGARAAVSVDASSASIEAARGLARERGMHDRITYRCGDFLELEDEISPADIVTLDKVICCYPAMEALVTRSADRALRVWAAVYPRDAWLIRSVNRVQNVFRDLTRGEFRTWVHPAAAIEALLRSRGFELRSEAHTFIWRIVVFERRAAAARS